MCTDHVNSTPTLSAAVYSMPILFFLLFLIFSLDLHYLPYWEIRTDHVNNTPTLLTMVYIIYVYLPVLYSAPPIPAGIRSFQWNSGGILQESSHSSGIPVDSSGILLEFHWNENGIKQTKVEILIYWSQFLKLCRYIHFCLSLPFWHHVYSSTYP